MQYNTLLIHLYLILAFWYFYKASYNSAVVSAGVSFVMDDTTLFLILIKN